MIIKDLGDGWRIETGIDAELRLTCMAIRYRAPKRVEAAGTTMDGRHVLFNMMVPMDRVEAFAACWRERQKESAK
jgi:hypothetical protein